MVSAAGFSYLCCWMLRLEAVSYASVLLFITLCVSVCAECFSATSASALSLLYCVWKKMTKEQEAKQHNPAITSTGTVCVRESRDKERENNQMSSELSSLSRHIWANREVSTWLVLSQPLQLFPH